MEVAWNQMKVSGLPQDMRSRLVREVDILRELRHPNIIRLYKTWRSEVNGEYMINFITESCSSSLRSYIRKHRDVHLSAIKSWARQILRGLQYLHTHDPPVIHRDLKSDNIFMNTNSGEIKLGDLGLAAIISRQREHYAQSVIGTPEFMAPELYDEHYDTRVDIYSFGMCVLELITREYPYRECENPAQIYKKVVGGVKPDALMRVASKVGGRMGSDAERFINLCIGPLQQRPSAMELLNDPFLQKEQSPPLSTESVNEEPTENRTVGGRKFSLKGRKIDDHSVKLKLRIGDNSGHARKCEFNFYAELDTPESVATELVDQLDLDSSDSHIIASEISSELTSSMPEWKSLAAHAASHREDSAPETRSESKVSPASGVQHTEEPPTHEKANQSQVLHTRSESESIHTGAVHNKEQPAHAKSNHEVHHPAPRQSAQEHLRQHQHGNEQRARHQASASASSSSSSLVQLDYDTKMPRVWAGAVRGQSARENGGAPGLRPSVSAVSLNTDPTGENRQKKIEELEQKYVRKLGEHSSPSRPRSTH